MVAATLYHQITGAAYKLLDGSATVDGFPEPQEGQRRS
jgi:hypothetical protein